MATSVQEERGRSLKDKLSDSLNDCRVARNERDELQQSIRLMDGEREHLQQLVATLQALNLESQEEMVKEREALLWIRASEISVHIFEMRSSIRNALVRLWSSGKTRRPRSERSCQTL